MSLISALVLSSITRQAIFTCWTPYKKVKIQFVIRRHRGIDLSLVLKLQVACERRGENHDKTSEGGIPVHYKISPGTARSSRGLAAGRSSIF